MILNPSELLTYKKDWVEMIDVYGRIERINVYGRIERIDGSGRIDRING